MNRPAQILAALEAARSVSVDELTGLLKVGKRTIANEVATLQESLGTAASLSLNNGRYRLLIADPVQYPSAKARLWLRPGELGDFVGYGDLAAKIPGGADWILADVAGVEPINEDVWGMVQSGVSAALAQPAALAAGDPDAFEGLVEGLVLSGLAMQANGGTRPASGAEHYFSHLWELEHLGADRNPPLSHGSKVAIGSLAMSAFYDALLAKDLSQVDLAAVASRRTPWEEIEADIRATFDGALADNAVRETEAKYVTGDDLVQRLQPIIDGWPAVDARLTEQVVTAGELSAMLQAAGGPSRPEDIGLTAAKVRDTFPRAMYYRSRYTALDVAWELGIFDELVEDVFTHLWNDSKEPQMITRDVTIASAVGLHARPASLFVKEAAGVDVPVTIAKDGKKSVDACSMLGVMTPGAKHGEVVTLTAEGEGAEEALEKLANLLETDLDA